MPLSFSEVEDALKQLYPENRIAELVFKTHPLLALMNSRTDFYGRNMFVPIRTGKPQGRSHTFDDARTAEEGSIYDGFTLTRISDFGLAQISGEAAEAAESEPARFIATLDAEMSGALSTLGDNMAMELYGNGGGSRGVIAAGGVTGDVITLEDPESIVFFEVAQTIVSADNDGTSGSLGAQAGAKIIAIDEDEGTITVDDIANLDSPVATDNLFGLGDRGLAVSGLGSWLPNVAPSGGDNHFGVDRSTQPSRLAGVRFDPGAVTIINALIAANARLRRSGGRVTHFFMNPILVSTLEQSLEASKRVVDVMSPELNIGFKAIGVMLATGEVPILADPDCPVDRCYGLQLDTWTRASLAGAPRVFDGDGLKFLRTTGDSFEIRVLSRWQVYTTSPGYNINIDMSGVTG
ncbi:MAG: phage major capsid protein [Deltaproteobacteria bacterium]|nr:phage major capsid protein [Deltaproteobacteria bacterium]